MSRKKGFKFSDETKRKMSESRKKWKFTEETKRKISNSNKGHIVSLETRNKLSKSHLGVSKNEKSWNWKGDNVGYISLHEWVVRYKGRANRCEICGVEGKSRYHWANVDHKYRRVLNDYMSMCVSCHKKYDLNNFKL